MNLAVNSAVHLGIILDWGSSLNTDYSCQFRSVEVPLANDMLNVLNLEQSHLLPVHL